MGQQKRLKDDQFEFRFRTNDGADITRKIEIPSQEMGIEWDDYERFFDASGLARDVTTKGDLLGKPSFFKTEEMVGHQLNHISLRYDPADLGDPV